jgi:putative hydrolase of the HAD superfamily
MAALRAILFDLDDTLLDTAGVERRRAVQVDELLGARVADLSAFWSRYRGHSAGRDRVDLGEVGYDAFRHERLSYALEPWSPLDDVLFEEYLELSNRVADTIEPLPGAVEVLRTVRRNGLRCGILTNGPSQWQRRKLDLTGVTELVDAVAISAEIGAAKPSPGAFHAACRALGADPSETAMVGDNEPLDVQGARAAGLARAFWVATAPLISLPGLLAA